MGGDNLAEVTLTIGATFPARIRKTISWNEYRSEITTQPKIKKLDYLIDPRFKNVKMFGVDPTRILETCLSFKKQ